MKENNSKEEVVRTSHEKPGPARVLFFSQTPFIAGGEINLLALVKTLNPHNITSYLCYNPNSHMEQYLPNSNIHLMPFGLPRYQRIGVLKVAYAMGKLMYLLLRHKIQLVYANTGSELKYLLPLCRIIGIPIIAHIHIQEEDSELRYISVNQVQRLLFPSKATMQGVLECSPWIDARKCFYVHNAVNMKYYYKRDTTELKAELGFGDGLPIIGVVGRLREDKGQHLFIEMARRLADEGVKAHFVVVGGDFNQQGDYEDYLKKKAQDLGIAQLVKFLGFRSDVPEMMSLCDLIIVPSLKEPFGRVVIEAMACETPVVASAVDGILEIFKDGQGGLFFETGSVEDLAQKVRYFFDHPDWWRDQKKVAWHVCNELFRQEVHTRKVEEHIFEVSGSSV